MQSPFQFAITSRISVKLAFLETNQQGNYLCESIS